ncbi:hypothetical protein ALC53_01932 [Atta colombica]|uniref:Uncharacterized protein n=1 Tax=Atta colombica TaxID=520822 RepID=A0A195BRI4_9HYME|nr:hypothetical protein ALC53_01932 [Atta colombica]
MAECGRKGRVAGVETVVQVRKARNHVARREANAEQEEARQDGREEEPRPVCASASESD